MPQKSHRARPGQMKSVRTPAVALLRDSSKERESQADEARQRGDFETAASIYRQLSERNMQSNRRLAVKAKLITLPFYELRRVAAVASFAETPISIDTDEIYGEIGEVIESALAIYSKSQTYSPEWGDLRGGITELAFCGLSIRAYDHGSSTVMCPSPIINDMTSTKRFRADSDLFRPDGKGPQVGVQLATHLTEKKMGVNNSTVPLFVLDQIAHPLNHAHSFSVPSLIIGELGGTNFDDEHAEALDRAQGKFDTLVAKTFPHLQ